MPSLYDEDISICLMLFIVFVVHYDFLSTAMTCDRLTTSWMQALLLRDVHINIHILTLKDEPASMKAMFVEPPSMFISLMSKMSIRA